jgi:hypothetical protein
MNQLRGVGQSKAARIHAIQNSINQAQGGRKPLGRIQATATLIEGHQVCERSPDIDCNKKQNISPVNFTTPSSA